MKIIGIRPSKFKGEDGSEVTGMNVYVTYPIDPDHGQGVASERIFLTDKKVSGWSYRPKVGDEVNVSYNRYGKCDGITLANK